MRYLSVCSGIEAASVAWHPLGWSAAAFSEIESFPRAVLKHRWPDVPLHGDFTTIKGYEYGPVDLLVGGTPCQSFSVAGLREGMDDPRGNLALAFLALAERLGARWLVWENVPGVLSSNEGRDFGAFLGGLAELGYGFAYRVLDAQYFGVPQRRRRVFVVGYPGDWRRAAAVLFERHSLSGHSPPRRETGEGVAARTGDGASDSFLLDVKRDLAPHGSVKPRRVASSLAASDYKDPPIVTHTLRADGFDASEDGTGRGTPLVPVTYPCLRSGNQYNNSDPGMEASMLVSFAENFRGEIRIEGGDGHRTGALNTGGGKPGQGLPAVGTASAVRRITPVEAERLQGFPDSYTLVPYRGKPAADGPRYEAIGNSFAVPVVRWLGERIQMVEAQ